MKCPQNVWVLKNSLKTKIIKFPLMVLCLEVYSSFFVDPQKFFRMTRKIFQILGECAHVWIECVWQMLTIKIFHALPCVRQLGARKKLFILIDETENVQSIAFVSSSTFFGIERRFLAMNDDHLSSVEWASRVKDDLANVCLLTKPNSFIVLVLRRIILIKNFVYHK